MTQRVCILLDGEVVDREIADPDDEVVAGVRWGDATQVFTPAYWLTQAWLAGVSDVGATPHLSRADLVAEMVFCLLGGHGITAELATAAYSECTARGLVRGRSTCKAEWRSALESPLVLGDRRVKYRFPYKKSEQIADAMRAVERIDTTDLEPIELRNRLLRVPGIGYKTASWIVRNVCDTDCVAIIDIHIERAGQLCGLFELTNNVRKDYLTMERRFLDLAQGIGVRASALDLLVWEGMRSAGDLPLRLLQVRHLPHSRRATARAST